jgi:hypothetical protein
VRDVGLRRGAKCHRLVGGEVTRKRDVGFDTEDETRRQHVVVADLHAAKEAAERVVARAWIWIEERGVRAAAAVADGAAEVSAGPVDFRDRRRLDPHQERNISRACRTARCQRGNGNTAAQQPPQGATDNDATNHEPTPDQLLGSPQSPLNKA